MLPLGLARFAFVLLEMQCLDLMALLWRHLHHSQWGKQKGVMGYGGFSMGINFLPLLCDHDAKSLPCAPWPEWCGGIYVNADKAPFL